MKKIAVVVQRYGVEITGGAELLTRLLSERLCNYYDIEIITTCAFDYTTWENYYPKGDCEVNGIRVRRFAVEKTRDMDEFKKLAIIPAKRKKEKEWVYKQGPYCPELIKYINAEKDTYDVFVFMTYLYYTTVFGIQEARNKAILIPTAHDEAPIYLGVYRDVFTCPKHFVFNTEEEQELVHRLYAGRIDQSKNCPELFEYFLEYKKRNPSDLKLVLMGKEFIEIPEHPDTRICQ
jgi:glycosyltransferase involved in cell wall biosynthesis